MNILLNKAQIIERCIRRIHEEVAACPEFNDFTHVDALILNLERACQATIDMAMHQVAKHHLGIPQGSAQAFEMLVSRGLLEEELSRAMRAMVGFRNVAIHEYQELNLDILKSIISTGLNDLVDFCRVMGIRIQPF